MASGITSLYSLSKYALCSVISVNVHEGVSLNLVKFVTPLSVHRITRLKIPAIRHRRVLRKRDKTS